MPGNRISGLTSGAVSQMRSGLRLAFLAPHVQAAILDARQPVDLSVAALLRSAIPIDWAEQTRLFRID